MRDVETPQNLSPSCLVQVLLVELYTYTGPTPAKDPLQEGDDEAEARRDQTVENGYNVGEHGVLAGKTRSSEVGADLGVIPVRHAQRDLSAGLEHEQRIQSCNRVSNYLQPAYSLAKIDDRVPTFDG